MATTILGTDVDASPPGDDDLGATAVLATPGSVAPTWIASILGGGWRTWGEEAAAPAANPQEGRVSHAPPELGPAESPTLVRAENAPVRLTMHGVLTAWRVADRALRELAEGTPEWAAVNATIISLRASYLARFEEYTSDRE